MEKMHFTAFYYFSIIMHNAYAGFITSKHMNSFITNLNKKCACHIAGVIKPLNK